MADSLLRMTGDRQAEFLLYDIIGEDFGGKGISAARFLDELNEIGPLDLIVVRINSPGGSVHDGMAIYNALVRHPARKEVEIDSLAASAASYVAMSGCQIRIAENASIMIHNAFGMAFGDADDMAREANVLRKIDAQIAAMFATRTGVPADRWRSAMDIETWYTADEAKAAGLVDAIIPNKATPTAINLALLNRFSKRPDKVAALANGSGTNDSELSSIAIRLRLLEIDDHDAAAANAGDYYPDVQRRLAQLDADERRYR